VLIGFVSVLSLGLVAAVGLLLVLAVRKLFEGTFRLPSVPVIVRPARPARGGGRGRPWAAGVREPRRPLPGRSGGSVALPEPPRDREAS
jgi:hypothetical protein